MSTEVNRTHFPEVAIGETISHSKMLDRVGGMTEMQPRICLPIFSPPVMMPISALKDGEYPVGSGTNWERSVEFERGVIAYPDGHRVTIWKRIR